MNEIDKTHSTPPAPIETGQPLPAGSTKTSGTTPTYDAAGAPSPKVDKDNAPTLEPPPDHKSDLSDLLYLAGDMKASSVSSVFEVMEVMEKMMIVNEKISEDEAITSGVEAAARLKDAAKAMREAASFMLGAGLAMGITQIAGGVISAGSAMKSSAVLSEGSTSSTTMESETSSESETEGPSATDPEASESGASASSSPTAEAGEGQQSSQNADEADVEMQNTEAQLERTVQRGNADADVTDPEQAASNESTAEARDAEVRENSEDQKASQKSKQAKGGSSLKAYQRAQNITTFGQGASQITQGMGQLISTVLKFYSDEKKAESSDIQADAATKKTLADQKAKYADFVQNITEKIYDQVAELKRSAAETAASMTRI